MGRRKGAGGFQRVGKVPVSEKTADADAKRRASLHELSARLDAGEIRRGNSGMADRPLSYSAWRSAVKARLAEERQAGRGLPGAAPNSILTGLLMHVNDAGETSPGVETLALLSGVSERTVRRCLRHLENAGWIEPATRRFRERGAMIRRICWPLPNLPDRPRRSGRAQPP
ncbi:helix-turn-helix domain-containing protein [Pukyongiella litopenaei]|uniref:Helix-turn-helix domain-containing protein n=1 Tax=Pukyongiella litopenaei TaxID=2605946 RepID=A0A2S0MPX5_9RHOB|nr:helix-turn-helix domain-containing protein [Pukyongiella litopenaei]AVO37925.1 helix-turn-helix domain-containing protein [Pukyongiella litopenaei]